ncbi:unnamed protein product [Closterium sp. NIES-53]
MVWLLAHEHLCWRAGASADPQSVQLAQDPASPLPDASLHGSRKFRTRFRGVRHVHASCALRNTARGPHLQLPPTTTMAPFAAAYAATCTSCCCLLLVSAGATIEPWFSYLYPTHLLVQSFLFLHMVSEQVLGLPPSPGPAPPFECPQPVQSQSLLQPVSPLPAPSPYTGPTGGLAERRAPASRRASPARPACTSRCTSRPRPPALPSPPASSLPAFPDPESDSLRAASPTVARFLATVVTDPSLESTAASALVAELVDFAARCRLDYAASLVAESASVCPPSVGGECALSTDVLEDRQEEFQCFAAALPHLVSTLLAPEGDPDAPDIPTPRSYAEAIEGPYSSQWQAAMDAEMASWNILARYVAPGRHRPEHMAAAKKVLRYLCSTSGMGLVLGGRCPVVLTGHADASWADDQATQRSSQGYTFSLGSGSVSWRSTCSSSVLGSSCEAEIYAGAMAAQELRWLTYLLTDLGEQPRSPPVLYVDNKAMLALCREHRLEHRTKHIALRYFLARELQQRGQLRLAYVASEANTADIFTKALAPGDHQRFCTMLACFALLDWSCDLLFSPTLPMGVFLLVPNSFASSIIPVSSESSHSVK